ncbi:hypothetical protein BN1195_04459 [Chryseobacterium oranimense G311]|uniref:hypothetical protein n=1 Tax=Chryseobacterium oranimense TaxID=421058 RepID=UPI00053386C6|nr:hypothetical protein [Chryseobacterium oranimense]CEJ72102.1 hypothetical protein BN1195_04459 [Chryseobacterium oranimense G311]
MTENQLLKELVNLENQLDILNIQRDLNYTDNLLQTEQEISSVENKILETKDHLIRCTDKKDSIQAKFSIIEQFQKYIDEINKMPDYLNLSRSQNMTKNIVFGLICQDIHYLVQDRPYGIRIPAYLIYTADNEDSINKKELTDFLLAEIETVKCIDSPDYVKLRQYFQQFKERIFNKFI